eukprot:m.228511 g.228511  ORF g.228511 m.228511 type:complete len:321 (-) comp38010_c0_seq1:60-1022(-)
MPVKCGAGNVYCCVHCHTLSPHAWVSLSPTVSDQDEGTAATPVRHRRLRAPTAPTTQPTSIRLADCSHCERSIDPYFEHELTTVLLFFLLRHQCAAVHLLHNRALPIDGQPRRHIAQPYHRALRTITCGAVLADAYLVRLAIASCARGWVVTAVWGRVPFLLMNTPWAACDDVGSGRHNTTMDGVSMAQPPEPGRVFLQAVGYALVSGITFAVVFGALVRLSTTDPSDPVPWRTVATATCLIKGLPTLLVASVVAAGGGLRGWHLPILLTLIWMVGQTTMVAMRCASGWLSWLIPVVAWIVSTVIVSGMGSIGCEWWNFL